MGQFLESEYVKSEYVRQTVCCCMSSRALLTARPASTESGELGIVRRRDMSEQEATGKEGQTPPAACLPNHNPKTQ